MKTPYLSVVIPAFNLSQNPDPNALEEVSRFLKSQQFGWEVIVVDDGSSDDTFKIINDFCQNHPGFKATTIEHSGKVGAVSAGVSEASGEIILFTDYDQSTPISEIPKFIDQLKDGADVVIANRIRDKKNDTIPSRLRSKLFNLFVQFLVLPGIPDTQCGFKAFKSAVAKDLFQSLAICKPRQTTGPYMGAWDVELLVIARKKKYKIKSVNVSWTREESKNLKIGEPFRMIIEVLRIKLFYSFKS